MQEQQHLSLPFFFFFFFFKSSSNLLWFPILGVFLMMNNVPTEGVIKLPENESIPAVFIFGDSIVDTGNNNDLITPAKSNFLPYGREFMGGKPTGRFSNGKVPSDLVVELLGIKELLPAYRDPNLEPQDLLTGVCFASGASGYDPLTPKLASAISLEDQLKLFDEYKEKVKGLIGEEGTRSLLARSLFIVVAGSNDIDNTYYLSRVRAAHYDISSYVNLIVQLASSFVKELYGMGGRKIGVFGAPTLGCLPSTRTLGGGPQRQCSEVYNDAAQLFNSRLSAALTNLNPTLPDSLLIYIDIYNPLLDIINHPQPYGFEIVDTGCCGTGEFEASIFCNQLSPHTCTDDTKYLFWDGYHPTEKAYRILVNQVVNKQLKGFICGGNIRC